jgi:hypothetical protein
MTGVIDAATAPIPRDRFGRPMVVPPGGHKPVGYTRCTTYVSALEDTYNLGKWQQRMVAIGLADRPDLLLAVSASQRDDKAGLNRIADQAMDAAKAGAASTTGTALHALTERIDRGEQLPIVPAAHLDDLDAYRAATRELEPLMIEQFTVLDELRIGGTPDRVVRYQGNAYIGDVKTGSIDYAAGKIAMQLAVYARSMPYDHATGERSPYPEPVDTSRGIVIHLPAGTGRCELHWIDLDAGWDGVRLAGKVRDWRTRKGLLEPWDVARPDTPATPAITGGVSDNVTAALAEIQAATTLDGLRAAYQQHVTSGVDGDFILPACLARKAELEGRS